MCVCAKSVWRTREIAARVRAVMKEEAVVKMEDKLKVENGKDGFGYRAFVYYAYIYI